MEFTISDRQEKIGYLCAILAAVMFGSVSTIAKPLASSVNPLLLSSLVYLVSAVVLTPIAHKTQYRPSSKRDYGLILIISFSGAVIAPILYFIGLHHASASDAALLSNGETLFTVLLATLFFRERIKPIGYAAVIMMLAGLYIVTTDLQVASIPQIHFEDMLIIIAMMFWAIDNNLSRILTERYNIARIAQIKSAIGGSLLLAAAFAFSVPMQINATDILPILLLGSVGFALSLYFFLQALKRINTVRTVMIFSLSTVVGLIAASIVLNEKIYQFQIIAAGIMIFGVYLLNRK